ncbi:unnamed protein product [Clonostachys rosea f. rosea IK726]|uniref:Choline monooxygenase, chloroplastic n=2 Tax=Bionectria ochroleuca TaxID=29856 RepID=A0A0B7KJK9_BIOOC|nr:unnamed protein product [Clonostachys rosea f. rosea IK726]
MAELEVTLPASWFTSKTIYDLERRAVFLKSWFLLGAVTKWPTVGDYPHEMVQVDLIVRRTSEDWTSLRVLAKDGSEVRSHLTTTGLLFVTLSNETPSFKESLPGLEDLIGHVDFTKREVRRSLRYVGKYNWKTFIDGFQECLHCAYAHKEFSKRYTPTTYKVLNNSNYSQHLAKPGHSPADGLFIYFFPNTMFNLYGGGMSAIRACPLEDPSTTMMEFDYYHDEPAGSEEFEAYYKFARRVGVEDHELCEQVQLNLKLDIYSAGILNPNKENGVAYYQARVLDLCSAQFEKEEREKLSRQPVLASNVTHLAEASTV